MPVVRVLNWHGVPPRLGPLLERQLDYLAARYRLARADELESLLADGPGERSVALLTFDDGVANHAEVVAPLVEARGATAIFSVPSLFPAVPAEEQPRWFREHVRSRVDVEHEHDDDVRALTWDAMRDLVARGHRIAAHTRTHRRLDEPASEDVLRDEIVRARGELEDGLGAAVDGFCWPVAEPASAVAHRLVRSTYAYCLAGGPRPVRRGHDPFRIFRTNIEASWPPKAVAFQLSGLMDVKFALTRTR